jgi:glycerate kinase
MKKIILAPDSFKGTMSSIEICDIMRAEINAVFPGCRVVSIPVADGGEGTVDSFLQAVEGQKINLTVKGPYFEQVPSFCALIDGGKTAVVEMAAAAGLPMVGDNKNPFLTTTYGVGQLVLHAVQSGAKDIVVGIGGSATNDGGAGMAAALGVIFKNKAGEQFVPVGGTLDQISSIDPAPAHSLLKGVTLRTMCDVDNPLFGENGAAYIFGPQKGADPEGVKILDQKLRAYGKLISAIPGKQNVCSLAGAGAAGGLGGGMYALLNASLLPGIDVVLDTVRFDELLGGADMVFTGEGRIDGQSLRGKVVIGVAKRAKPKGVPVCAIVGDALDDGLAPAFELGVTSVITINRLAIPFEQAKPRAKTDLAHTMKNILRLMAAL